MEPHAPVDTLVKATGLPEDKILFAKPLKYV
jgi:hypothetical protein